MSGSFSPWMTAVSDLASGVCGPTATPGGPPTVLRVTHPPTPPSSDLTLPTWQRFLTLNQVAEELTVSRSQVFSLLRDRSLVAFKIVGRGVWRAERCWLQAYAASLYRTAAHSASSASSADTAVDDLADELADQ